MKLAVLAAIVAGIALGLWAAATGPTDRPAPAAGTGLVTTPQSAPPRGSSGRRETVLTRAHNGHFYVAAEVDGRPVRFVVDTGATGLALTPGDARAAGIAVDRAPVERVGTGAGGAVYGRRVRLREVAIDGKRATDLTAVVIDGLPVSLLGQSYLRTLDSVRISGDTMTLR